METEAERRNPKMGTGKKEEQREMSGSLVMKVWLVFSGFPHKAGVSPPETPTA